MGPNIVLLTWAMCSWGELHAPEEELGGKAWIRVEANARWCGAKGLWLVARGYGLDHNFDHVKTLCDPHGTSEGFVSLTTLEKAASKMGLFAAPIRCRLDWLKRNRLPALTVHRSEDESGSSEEANEPAHCLVLLKYENGQFHLLDPYLPASVVKLSEQAFAESWTGEVLLLAPRPEDLPTNRHWSQLLIGCAILDIAIVACVWAMFFKWRRGLAAAAVLSCLSALEGCSHAMEAPAPPSSLEFEHTRCEALVEVVAGGPRPSIRHTFGFVNSGHCPIKIRKVETDCSCMVVQYTEGEIPPGQRGEVTVQVDLEGRAGHFETSALVSTSDADNTGILLTVAAFALAPPFADPASLNFGEVVAGQRATRNLKLVIPLKPTEVCPGVKSTLRNESFRSKIGQARVEVDRGGIGRHAVLQVQCSLVGESAGAEVKDVLTVRVDNRKSLVSVPLRAWVSHPSFTVEPRLVNLGPIPPEGVKRRVVIRRAAGNTASLPLSVDVERASDINVSLEQNPKDPAETSLWIEAIPGERAFLAGDIKIRANGRDNVPYSLRYIGYVVR